MFIIDVEAQEIASHFASQFNAYLPPDAVSINYVPAVVLELVDRPGRPLCGCEQLIDGEFKKHNNNVGAAPTTSGADDARKYEINVAQAFSHFSYEQSGHQLLICDIQGFNALYTDPQIHTVTGKGFGAGNLGQTGIRAFLLRHTCNELCAYAKLPVIQAKNLTEG